MLEILLKNELSRSIIDPEVHKTATAYLMKIMSEENSPYFKISRDENISNEKLGIMFTHYTFTNMDSTILKIDSRITDQFVTWDCVPNKPGNVSIANCTGFYISEIRFDGELYDKYLLDRYTGGAISDVYQIDAWFKHPIEKTMRKLNLTNNGSLIEVNFPLKDKEVLVGDDIQVSNSKR